MEKKQKISSHRIIGKSKFIRSVIFTIVPLFLVIIMATVTISFVSLRSEFNNKFAKEQYRQLCNLEELISERMTEVWSIAYNISIDYDFRYEHESADGMAAALKRFMVGNDFVEHIAYYKVTQPDVIYTPNGSMDFRDFSSSYMKIPLSEVDSFIGEIAKVSKPMFVTIHRGDDKYSYFSYTYPIMNSDEPSAFVLMLIPYTNVKSIITDILANNDGIITIYDDANKPLITVDTCKNSPDISPTDYPSGSVQKLNNQQYVIHNIEAQQNGWVYSSIVRIDNAFYKIGSQQVIAIILLVGLLFLTIAVTLIVVIVNYRPLKNLVVALYGESNNNEETIDEQTMLSDTYDAIVHNKAQRQAYETAYLEADAANKAKSIFFSNMSHDIRTPLNAIIGMTEIAKNNAKDIESLNDCIDKIATASKYLLNIINNVLDMSRIESGKMILSEEAFELSKVIYDIESILNDGFRDKGLSFIVNAEDIQNEKLIGDSVRLSQIFVNILSNSEKYTPKGGTITFSVRQLSAMDGKANYQFDFTDTGMGMSKEFLSKLFQSFSRDENARVSQIEGTGLGLAITKSFIDMMGGSITCESELNVGTHFRINLSFKMADNETQAQPVKYPNFRLLVVCDNDAVAKQESALFEAFDVKTNQAKDVESALALMREVKTDGDSFEYVIINRDSYDNTIEDDMSQFVKYCPSNKTTYVLAMRDLSAVPMSQTYDAGIYSTVHTPLFPSTVRHIIQKDYSRQHSSHNKLVDLNGMKVLLVEDNYINMQIAQTLLSATHVNITAARNGAEAIDEFANKPEGYFDAILMDLQMPILNGYEATAAIRAMDRSDSTTVPIIAMTANTFEEDIIRVKAATMNAHLAKPYTSEELNTVLCMFFKPKA